MNRRSKYMWTDRDRERKMEVSKPLQPPVEASLSEVTAGPSKATTEKEKVVTQPPIELTTEPTTENISAVPAIKNDRELPGSEGNTDVPEPVQEYLGHEKREETAQPQLEEGAPNSAMEDVFTNDDETEHIKSIVALRRNILRLKLSISNVASPGVVSTCVDVVSPIVLEIPVDEAAHKAEKATTQEAVGVKENLVTENIAESPVMADKVESRGSGRTTDVPVPLLENSGQFPGKDGEGKGDVKEVCSQTSDRPRKNNEEDETANMKTEVPEPANESPAQISEKREDTETTETFGVWKEATQPIMGAGTGGTGVRTPKQKFVPAPMQPMPEIENTTETPVINNTNEDEWFVGTTENTKPLKKVSAQVSESQKETKEACGIEEEATQLLLQDAAAQEVERLEKTLALRRMLPSVIAGNELILNTIHDLTPTDMAKILEKMECLDCKSIPSPYRLFQCPRGHHYCFECGAKRFTTDDKGDIGSGSCDHEMEDTRDGCGATRGVGNGLIRPDFPLAEGEIEELSKDGETGKAKCCLRIRKSMGEALYKAIYNNTKWNCPNMELGCNEKIFGRDFEEHAMDCIRKFGFL